MSIMRLLLVTALIATGGCQSAPPAAKQSAACKMSIQAMPDSATSTQDPTSLRLIDITPAVGSTLDESSLLAATLEYHVKDFETGRFKIMAQFSLEEPRKSTDGDFPRSAYPILPSPTGRVHFCFPVAYIWHRPVELPLNLRFFLNRLADDPRKSSVIAQTEHLLYPAAR